MATISELKQWIREDLHPATSSIVIKKDTANSGKIRLTLYTATNAYHIVAREESDYLGCVADSRKNRPGEDWSRGGDLPDGPLEKATWKAILNGMIRFELQQITKAARDSGVETLN